MDFGLARFDARQRTRRLELPQISADPAAPLVLVIAELGSANANHYNWVLKHAAPDPATIPAEGTDERTDFWRRRHAEFIGAVAIVGWENVTADGDPAPCTPEHGQAFMRQLLEHRLDVFDQVVAFVYADLQKPDVEPAAPPTDASDLGKE